LLALFSASLGHKKGGLKDIDHSKKQKLVRQWINDNYLRRLNCLTKNVNLRGEKNSMTGGHPKITAWLI